MEAPWEIVGALAEALAAVAVIASLVYLSIQLRQNNRLLENSAHATYYELAAQGLTARAVGPPGNLEIFNRGLADPNSLSGEEMAVFNTTMHAMFITFQYCYRMKRDQGVDDAITDPTLQNMFMLLASPGGKRWWQSYPVYVETEFTEFVNEATGMNKKISESI